MATPTHESPVAPDSPPLPTNSAGRFPAAYHAKLAASKVFRKLVEARGDAYADVRTRLEDLIAKSTEHPSTPISPYDFGSIRWIITMLEDIPETTKELAETRERALLLFGLRLDARRIALTNRHLGFDPGPLTPVDFGITKYRIKLLEQMHREALEFEKASGGGCGAIAPQRAGEAGTEPTPRAHPTRPRMNREQRRAADKALLRAMTAAEARGNAVSHNA